MKEALIIVASLALATFIVLAPQPHQEYYLYKGDVRIHQLYAELESIEPRAMIYARSKVDSFLAEMNGTACELEPKVDPNEFREILSEDLSYKGFWSSLSTKFSVSETRDGGSSSPYFGSYCRKGGISVKLDGEASLKDDLTGIYGERTLSELGCQQTAYYRMRKALERLENEIKEAVEKASRELPNLTEFFRKLNDELRILTASFREENPDLELKLSYTREWYYDEEELRVHLHFLITLKDPYGLFIMNGKEWKGFWCKREVVLNVKS